MDQKSNHMGAGEKPGTLFIVGTPLGNLEDITLRAIRTLQEVDLIAAEDTRRTGKLLLHLQIEKPLISYYQHNEQARTQELISRLAQGAQIALVTDAGMPGISDPGAVLIVEALAANIAVVPIPGPTAATTALVISGLPTERYVFEGFLPRTGKSRRARWTQLVGEVRTIVLYEAPHRLLRTLSDAQEHLGDRPAAVARELTKLHEECVRSTLSELQAHFTTHTPRGEIVLVIAGAQPDAAAQKASPEEMALQLSQLLLLAMQSGLSRRDAVKAVVKQTGLSRQQVYQASLEIAVDSNVESEK